MRAILLSITLLFVMALPASADIVDKRQQLEDIQNRIKAIKKEMSADRQARSKHIATLERIERKIGRISERLDALKEDIKQTRAHIQKLTHQVREQQRQLEERKEQLAARIRAAYRVGRQSRLQIILSQDNPAKTGRLLGYYEYYAEAQSDLIANIRTDIKALRQTRNKLAAKKKRLQDKKDERKSILARLKASQDQRRNTIKAIETRLARRGDEVDKLRANAKELEKLIKHLQENLAGLTNISPDVPFAERKGHLLSPLDGKLIAAFGDAKAGGRLEWEGVWYAAEAGTPVRAVAPGRVVYVGWMYSYGLVVVLNHGNQYYTVYGHNQSAYVKPGDYVRAGDKIATAGNSGGHTATGVYLEIRHESTPLDPSEWLRS